MRIGDWPDSERPREKLLGRGPDSLGDAELLAVLLGTGIRGVDAVTLARQLLARFGGLRGLLGAAPDCLLASPGIGQGKACKLLACLELARRHLGEDLRRGPALLDPGHSGRYLKARLRDYPYEVFAVLFLDTRHRPIACEELFRGSIDGAAVHPREVVRRALAHNAAAVILAHNHPSGVAEPSDADRLITRRLADALALVEVRVLDHLVIGDGEPVSLAARGWL
ncbi:MAG: DNA repair protein RadC [Pseudoxanthomonas sp.]|nr:DNA repair protein RadC [Pseudoxanthomonas sp.]